jgi:hypothetical protein
MQMMRKIEKGMKWKEAERYEEKDYNHRLHSFLSYVINRGISSFCIPREKRLTLELHFIKS